MGNRVWAQRDLPPRRNKGIRFVEVLTLTGIEGGTVSPGARAVCCTFAVNEDFAQTAADLKRVTGLGVSKEHVRQIVHREAQSVIQARSSGALAPAWSAEQAVTEPGGLTPDLCRR